MNTKDFIYHETVRMKIYQLLSEFFQIPKKGMNPKLRELTRHLTKIDSILFANPDSMLEAFSHKEGLDLLLVDYSQLFVGPYSLAAPPYGSVYLDTERKVMGNSTVDAKARYARYGIDVDEGFMDMPDHIVAELEFMYFLIFREIECLQLHQYKQACDFLFEQNLFVNDHLNAWIPEFSDLVGKYSDTEYYSNLALATQRYIKWDLEYLSGIDTLEMQDQERSHAAL